MQERMQECKILKECKKPAALLEEGPTGLKHKHTGPHAMLRTLHFLCHALFRHWPEPSKTHCPQLGQALPHSWLDLRVPVSSGNHEEESRFFSVATKKPDQTAGLSIVLTAHRRLPSLGLQKEQAQTDMGAPCSN